MKRFSALLFLITVSAVAATDFHKDVAPILREYCAGCHNNDDPEGEFSVETFQSLIKGGESGKPIHAGNAQDSLLIRQLTGLKKPFMPPRKKPQPSVAQIEILETWIAEGAKGPAEDRSILANLNVPKAAAAKLNKQPITAMTIPRGNEPAFGYYGKVKMGKWTFSGHAGKVNALSFSPDGNYLLAATGITG